MAEDNKVAVYNLPDIKSTSDDAIPNYLASLGFKESHSITDLRLGLGYASLAVAGACFYWDYKLGFDDTKMYSLVAVAVYALLNLALTHFTNVQGDNVYYGTTPSGESITISTKSPKYTPVYQVTVTVTGKAKGSKSVTSIERPFSEWFDSAGNFVALPFQKMFAVNVPVIAAADPKRAAPAVVEEVQALPQYSADVLDMLAAATPGVDSEASATGTSAGKKGGKRRKN